MAVFTIVSLGDLRRLSANLPDTTILAFQDKQGTRYATEVFIAPYQLAIQNTFFKKEDLKKAHLQADNRQYDGVKCLEPPALVLASPH